LRFGEKYKEKILFLIKELYFCVVVAVGVLLI